MRLLASLLLISALAGNAATYYVATNGNNSASGLLGFPWLTISNGVQNAVAGDTVSIGQGVYNEKLVNGTSGTAGNPITFVGTRDTNGNWLTVIDPSTTVTSGWLAAPEIGSGVFKYTNTFKVFELYINNQRVPFVYTVGDASSEIGQAYDTTNTITTGAQMLTLASNAVLKSKFNGSALVTFWNSTKALWCNDTNNVVYLRLVDGSSPDGLSVSFSGNWTTVLINQRSFINWSNVYLRNGGINGFALSNGTNATHHCNISSNRVDGGEVHIIVASYGYYNNVYGNLITANYYGLTSMGAWNNGTNATADKENVYLVSKFLMGQGGSLDTGIFFNNCGNSNTVTFNTVYQTIGTGIELWDDISLYPIIQTNTVVAYNTVTNHSSVGILLSEGETTSDVYSNYVADSDINFRYHHMDITTETNRTVYVHRNTSWLPDNIGNHVYFHFGGSGSSYCPTFWTYHNSYSGGYNFVDLTTTQVGPGWVTNGFFINNITSTNLYAGAGNFSLASWNTNLFGAFDYNIVTPPLPTYPSSSNPFWYGAHNIKSTTNIWASVPGMSFTIPAGSQAIGAALDTSSAFTLNGRSFAALPDGATELGGSWDIGAFENQPPSFLGGTMTVNQLNVGQANFY